MRSDSLRVSSEYPLFEDDRIAAESKCVTLPTLQQEGSRVSPKKTFLLGDKQVLGESIEVESSSEPWAQYTLADGTTVKAKMVLLEAVRLEAHNDLNGDPIYQFQFQQIIGTVSPESLKRKVH
jgi:hypothetical protein